MSFRHRIWEITIIHFLVEEILTHVWFVESLSIYVYCSGSIVDINSLTALCNNSFYKRVVKISILCDNNNIALFILGFIYSKLPVAVLESVRHRLTVYTHKAESKRKHKCNYDKCTHNYRNQIIHRKVEFFIIFLYAF